MKHIVFANYQATYGGGERVLIEQIAALAQLPVKVSVVFEDFPEQRDIEAELRERNPNFAALVHLPSPWACLQWLLRNRPDAAMVLFHRPFLTALRRLARLGYRQPVAATLHEHYPCCVTPYRTTQHLIQHWVLDYDFRTQFRGFLRSGTAHIVHPLYRRPATVAWGAAERAAARRQLGLPDNGFVVGYVGRQGINKEPWVTLTIAEQLQQHLPQPVHALFVGHESAEVKLRMDEAVGRSPLLGRIWRRPKMADNRPAFHALDLFVLPSWSEGFFPLSLIEAMERGVPVLTTTVGGIGTVLQDGQGGFLIPKTDDRQPLTATAIGQAHLPLLPHLADPARWEWQREKAAQVVHRLHHGYDAHGLYRAVFCRLLNLADEQNGGAATAVACASATMTG